MASLWILKYGKKAETIMKQMEEYHMMGSYGGKLNLMEIISTIGSAINEIHKQDVEILMLKQKISDLEKKTPQPSVKSE